VTGTKKIVAAVLTPLVLGGTLLVAQPQPSQASETPPVTVTESKLAYGQGLGLRMGFRGGMLDAVSKLLGMDVADIRAERRAGKSLAAIAGEKGVDEDTLVQALMSGRQQVLNEKVAAGQITQEQANYCLENMEQRIKQNIERTSVGPNGQGRGGKGGAENGADRGMGRGPRQGGGPYYGRCPYLQQ